MSGPRPAGSTWSGTAAATAALVALTAAWGSTFTLIKDLLGEVSVADFLAVRFTMAAALMLVLFPLPARTLGRRGWTVGLALGALYGFAQILQTWGLERTPASVAGFITGMYVVLTPVFALVLFARRTPATTWAAVLLATVGLAVLSLSGWSVGVGEMAVLGCAALYALHILGLERFSPRHPTLGLSTAQVASIALICAVAAVPGGVGLPVSAAGWAILVYTVVAASVGALVVQTWAQARMSATRAAVVMTMEPVFATLFAVWIGDESLGWRLLVGGTLVLIAMYLVELAPRRGRPAVRADVAPPAEARHHEA